MHNLKAIWNALSSSYTTNNKLADVLWEEIETCYAKEKRPYHNLAHLEFMTTKALAYKNELKDPDTVLFSIFYHDIIYKPTQKDNEQKSASVAKDRLAKLGVPAEKISSCYQQIMATKAHKQSNDTDTNYLLDFDLAILGETPENYRQYTRQIRKEYAFYPDFLYKQGRKQVLQHFLAMDRIFKTEAFYSKFEAQARTNVKQELQDLY